MVCSAAGRLCKNVLVNHIYEDKLQLKRAILAGTTAFVTGSFGHDPIKYIDSRAPESTNQSNSSNESLNTASSYSTARTWKSGVRRLEERATKAFSKGATSIRTRRQSKGLGGASGDHSHRSCPGA